MSHQVLSEPENETVVWQRRDSMFDFDPTTELDDTDILSDLSDYSSPLSLPSDDGPSHADGPDISIIEFIAGSATSCNGYWHVLDCGHGILAYHPQCLANCLHPGASQDDIIFGCPFCEGCTANFDLPEGMEGVEVWWDGDEMWRDVIQAVAERIFASRDLSGVVEMVNEERFYAALLEASMQALSLSGEDAEKLGRGDVPESLIDDVLRAAFEKLAVG